MISNDLRSSCRALLIGAYQNSGKYDPIFHDILENSEAFCTINIDDVYKFTLNLWVTSRGDVPCCRYRDYTNLAAKESYGVGYSQSPVIYTRAAFTYRILWKNDKPMYAALVYNQELPRDFPWFFDINDGAGNFIYYMYRKDVHEYIKGSAAAACDPQLYIKPTFNDSIDGTKYLNLGKINIVDGSGKSVTPRCTYKLRHKTYSIPYGYLTEPPKVTFNKESMETYSIVGSYSGSNLFIFSCSDMTIGAIYSDLPEAELNGLTDELIKAICEKYGDKSCYTHIPPQLLTPEEEEST